MQDKVDAVERILRQEQYWASSRISEVICSASSRVGASTTACTWSDSWSMCSIIGIPKARKKKMNFLVITAFRLAAV